jgi:peptide/nickel transport system ATP-binding protein/oligopeptide transport system ATP-binding protein
MTTATAATLEVTDLQVEFATRGSRQRLRAVDGVSFSIGPGETFGLIGESGSGKSTVARAVMRLVPVCGGSIAFGGVRLHELTGRALSRERRRIAMVFQDPHDALDPRMSVARSIAEPITLGGSLPKAAVRARVDDLIERVGLGPDFATRRPHELSGGQKQRVNIARALALDPALLICDEAVSALDLSIQAGILNLLMALQRELELPYLFISHDLAVVRHMADRVGVMYLGQVVETGPTGPVVNRPRHPYTEVLLSAEPQLVAGSAGRRARIIPDGDVPSPLNPPSGCRFRTRCRYAVARCADEVPVLRPVDADHAVACHLAEALELQGMAG